MYTKDTTVRNQTGIHARPASVFVRKAREFASAITVENLDKPQEKPVNAKAIMLLMTLGLSCGTNVRISASGEDEIEAVESLVELINNLTD